MNFSFISCRKKKETQQHGSHVHDKCWNRKIWRKSEKHAAKLAEFPGSAEVSSPAWDRGKKKLQNKSQRKKESGKYLLGCGEKKETATPEGGRACWSLRDKRRRSTLGKEGQTNGRGLQFQIPSAAEVRSLQGHMN